MTENEQEAQKKLRDFMMALLNGTDISEAEKEDCVEQCPGYLQKVIHKSINRDKETADAGVLMRYAILGFIGGYASRHLYDLKPKNHNN